MKSNLPNFPDKRAFVSKYEENTRFFMDKNAIYLDDGYSGTDFNRPGFQEMLADVKAGKISRVIVKDMACFGRDYLQVGMYTDILFPDFGVHFITVNDGVDSTRGDNEFTAIRNVFNEMYARDTSKKICATWQSKGKSGEHLITIPPYGGGVEINGIVYDAKTP